MIYLRFAFIPECNAFLYTIKRILSVWNVVVKGDGVVCGLNNSTAVVLSSSTKNSLSSTSALAGNWKIRQQDT